MASKLSPARQFLGATRRSWSYHGSRRHFRRMPAQYTAQNFMMPAMSPTMTEGNIATWKVEEGQAFTAGDVLLEVETDKAQMDVEAQDDGILARIMQPGGSKGIKVGTRIAVLAGPDDDLNSLELPTEARSSPTQQSEEPGRNQASPPKQESSPQVGSAVQPDRGATANAGGKVPAQKGVSSSGMRKYPLYPSVTQLLHENGIDISRAAEIPATGPNGRLLKGDVLAFLGTIDSSYPRKQSDRLAKLSHLDLGNINRTTARQPDPSTTTQQTSTAPQLPPSKIEVVLPISLSAVAEAQQRVKEALGVDIPLETFIARAVRVSNSDLPRPNVPPTADELFDQVLGLDEVKPKQWRGNFTPRITSLPAPSSKSQAGSKPKVDILDILLGEPKASTFSKAVPLAQSQDPGTKLFSIEVSKADQKRGMLFLERIKTILQEDPGRLIV